MNKINVAYIRTAKVDNDAVRIQKERIKLYANENNMTIDYYYVDNGFSGTNMERPEFNKMLNDMKTKDIKSITFTSIDRLGRNMTDIAGIIHIATERNIDLNEIIGGNIMNTYKELEKAQLMEFKNQIAIERRKKQSELRKMVKQNATS